MIPPFPNTSLPHRAVLTLSGPDRKKFLQGIITNNVAKIAPDRAIYAALLTPQGKYLFDFFLFEQDEILYLDCEKDRAADLYRRLMMYKLRADVEITPPSDDLQVIVCPENLGRFDKCFADPRHPDLGFRALLETTSTTDARPESAAYEQHRLTLGIPDGTRDFDIDKTLVLEGNLEELNGVDFDKGCYVGQEVTARMKHRTNLKKRLLPVKVEGPLPERGSPILNPEGKKVGDLRSGDGRRAIGYFRLADSDTNTIYKCEKSTLTLLKPDWLGNL